MAKQALQCPERIGGGGVGCQKIFNNFRDCLPVKRLDYVQTLISCLPCSTNGVDRVVFFLLCPIHFKCKPAVIYRKST